MTTTTTTDRMPGHRSVLFRHTWQTQHRTVSDLFIPKGSHGRVEGWLILYHPNKAGEWATIDPQWENESVLSTVDSFECAKKRMVMDCSHLWPCICPPGQVQPSCERDLIETQSTRSNDVFCICRAKRASMKDKNRSHSGIETMCVRMLMVREVCRIVCSTQSITPEEIVFPCWPIASD